MKRKLLVCVALLPAPGLGCSSERTAPDSQEQDASVATHPDAARADVGVDGRTEFDSAVTPDVVDATPSANTRPLWSKLPQRIAGCEVERLANPGQVHVFRWVPCEGSDPKCERAEVLEGVFDYRPDFGNWGPNSAVSDQSGTVRLALASGDLHEVYLLDEKGTMFDGFRNAPGSECIMPGASIWGDRLGVAVHRVSESRTVVGGLLRNMSGDEDLATFTTPELPGTPQAHWMGKERWSFWWVSPDKLVSVSTKDGSEPIAFAPTNMLEGPVYSMGASAVANDRILVLQDYQAPGERFAPRIAISDGKQEPTAYLDPPEDSYLGGVAFADSHVAWMRGINPSDLNTFERVEIWASPYSPNPSELKPYKVGDWTGNHISADLHFGGYGRYACPYGTGSDPFQVHLVVWDLARKTQTTYDFPTNVRVMWKVGMTKDHAWFVGGPDPSEASDWLIRFKLN